MAKSLMMKSKGIASASPMPSSDMDDYRAEDDHRALSRAEEIRGDKARMAGVKRVHVRKTRQMMQLGSSLRKKRLPSRGRRR